MEKVVQEAILSLIKQTKDALDVNDALKYSQTALNLAHTFATFKSNAYYT